MKKTILVSVLVLTLQFCVAQTYVLDPTFGAGGKFIGDRNIGSKALLAQGKYFLMSENTINCIDYNGVSVSDFGTNGSLTIGIATAGEIFTPIDFKYHNQAIYLFGNTFNNTTGFGDMIVCKMNLDGHLDDTFGVNGIARVDFSPVEKLQNLVFESDGGLLCVGSKTDPVEKAIYFKLLPNGAPNYNYDASGYKTLTVGQSSGAGAITAYGADYLIVGHTKLTEGSGIHTLFIAKVDADGDLDTGYGTMGFHYSSLPQQMGSRYVEKVRLHNDKLYIKHRYPIFPGKEFLQIYDLTTNEKVYEQELGNRYDFEIVDEKIYSLNYVFDMVPAHMNPTKFNLSRCNLDGSTDPTFHNAGLFNYEFPYNSVPSQGGSSIPGSFIPESDGKFAIAGYFYEYNATQFGMIRIVPETLLATAQSDSESLGLYPNPFDTAVHLKYVGNINSVAVYDLIGRAIGKPAFVSDGEGIVTIDLSQLTQSGTYLLRISGNTGAYTKKIVKR